MHLVLSKGKPKCLTTLSCPFLQVFDATNTTRERRDMILQFGSENDFKVSVAMATRGVKHNVLDDAATFNNWSFLFPDLFY